MPDETDAIKIFHNQVSTRLIIFPMSNELCQISYLLKIKWSDKVSNKEVIQRMKDTELHVLNSIKKQKLAFARHVLRGSSGSDALQILEGKLENKSAQGRPRRMWLDDIKTWTNLDSYEVIKRTAEGRNLSRSCTRAACLPYEAELDS